jgi:transposase
MIPEREDQRKQRRQKGQQGGRPCRYDHEMYRWRNVVERCINKLKQFRRVATRYDKRADSFLAFVTLATILLWLR